MRENVGTTPPTLVSLLLCDQIIDDRLTNKKSAIGLFNVIIVANAPSRVQNMTVMATLTEIARPSQVELRLVRDADNAILLSTQGTVDAPDPLSTVELVFALQGIVLPSTGQYAFEVLSGAELLGRRRFAVIQGQRPEGTGG